jgi:hypothetical protein
MFADFVSSIRRQFANPVVDVSSVQTTDSGVERDLDLIDETGPETVMVDVDKTSVTVNSCADTSAAFAFARQSAKLDDDDAVCELVVKTVLMNPASSPRSIASAVLKKLVVTGVCNDKQMARHSSLIEMLLEADASVLQTVQLSVEGEQIACELVEAVALMQQVALFRRLCEHRHRNRLQFRFGALVFRVALDAPFELMQLLLAYFGPRANRAGSLIGSRRALIPISRTALHGARRCGCRVFFLSQARCAV